MKVLIACETSGIVREAFRKLGHDAWSCDLLPAEDAGCHKQDDAILVAEENDWDLMIAHPPCTHLSSSGARWFKDKQEQQKHAIWFASYLFSLEHIPKIAIENPIGILSTVWGKPDQIIQPWQFGHGETKATCLWLRGLPTIRPTNIVPGRSNRIHRLPPSPTRWKERSRTYQGIADAFASQWG